MIDTPLENQTALLYKSWLKVIALSSICFGVFFIAEHNPKIAKTENFVTEIDEQENWADGGNNLRRIAFVGCAGLGILSLMMGSWKNFRWNYPVILLFAYLFWCGLSVMWSDSGVTTVRRFVLMMFSLLGCVGITRFYSPVEILRATAITAVLFALVGIGAEVFFGAFRPHRSEYRFAGTLHPNAQAASLSMLCLALYTLTKMDSKNKLLYFMVLGIAMFMVLLTKSRTAALALLIGLSAIWAVHLNRKTVVLLGAFFIWFGSIAGLGMMVTGINPITENQDALLLGRGEETGSSLTGRLPLWKDLSVYIVDQPLGGYGFGAFWDAHRIRQIAISQEWVISEAHSSYVDAALEVGLVGCVLMILVALATLWFGFSQYHATKQPYFLFFVGAVVFCIIRSFSESGLGRPSGFVSPLYLLMFCHCWTCHKENETDADGVEVESDHE